jgi:penicillin-binding protein 1A
MKLTIDALRKRYKLVIAVTVAVVAAGVYFVYLLSGLPSLEQLENPRAELSTKVYSIDGEVLDKFFVKNRAQITLDELPPHIVEELLATEDKNFHSHWGVDLPRFARAMVKNVVTLQLREGASTITQQLARNLYALKGARESLFGKVTRKLREFVTAVQIERNYTKEEILEMYLSVAYFGRSAYGISTAAQTYFGKHVADLTKAEAAVLIGLLRGPAVYDPFNHPDRALSRRNTVLSQMVKYDYMKQEECAKLQELPLGVNPADVDYPTGIAPHFVEWIRQSLIEKAEEYGFDIYRDGLSVYTTLDSRMQKIANRAVETHLKVYQPAFSKAWKWDAHPDVLKQAVVQAIRGSDQYRVLDRKGQDSLMGVLSQDRGFIDSIRTVCGRIEVGFVALDHSNGNILAMVGGSNFKNFKYGLNHVTQIVRQPGSAFKPFVYTVAIDNGYPPSFEILNQPITLVMANGKRWAPNNFDGTFGGKSTLRDALAQSINLVAIRTIMEIAPVKQVIEYARRMGIHSELPPYESLAIGTGEVQPLEITSAYGIYANEGVAVEPIAILRIEDKYGNVIEENHPKRREVLSKETAYLMTSMMEGNVNVGSGIQVRRFFGGPAAGKTGTTQEFADAWFIGFTPAITAGVWVGFDNKSVHFTNNDGQGGRAAAPIWGRFMHDVYADPSIGMSMDYFVMPDGIERDTICVESKKKATPWCPEVTEEIFNRAYPPGDCPLHGSSQSGRRKSKNSISF